MQRSEGVGNDEASDNEAASKQSDAHSQQRYPRTYELDHMVITLLSRASGGLTMEDIVDELDSDEDSISNSIDRIGDKVKTEVENGMAYYYILHEEEKPMEKTSGIGLAIMEVIKVSGAQTLDQIIRKVQSISSNSRQQIHQSVNRLIESNDLETADGTITVYRIPQDSDEHELHMDTVSHIFNVILGSGPLTSEDIHIKVKAVAKSRTYVTTALRLLLKGGLLMLNDGLYHFHSPQGSDEDQGRSSLN